MLSCTESDDVRLIGGTSHCNGELELKHQGEWRTVDGLSEWNRKLSAVVCRQLNCGNAVSDEETGRGGSHPVWRIISSCVGSESSLTECATKHHLNTVLRRKLVCSGKNGGSLLL